MESYYLKINLGIKPYRGNRCGVFWSAFSNGIGGEHLPSLLITVRKTGGLVDI